MRIELLDYELPPEAIAQRPPERRDGGRLLVLHRHGVEHRRVHELVELIPAGALVVLNDSRVIPARLRGSRLRAGGELGGKVELLLLERLESRSDGVERWSALGKARRPLSPDDELAFEALRARVLGRGEGGVLTMELRGEGVEDVAEALRSVGHVPLPPYIQRDADASDVERYQTVFARRDGSVAAPTAGLHLTPEALARLEARGVHIARVTLHVGLGTFRPVSSPDLDAHVMHEERYELGSELVEALRAARSRGAPVFAIGTTVVRALESAARDDLGSSPGPRTTQLMIQPGFEFRVVDGLLTNFHQPRSTLLALVSALVGRERLLSAYRVALAEGYRFLSYGDAMWIPRRLT